MPHPLLIFCQSDYLIQVVGWLGGAKVSCILCHWGIQLILACSWARPAILVAGKGSWGMFLFQLFLHFHSCSSFFPVLLFHLFFYLFYLFSPFLWKTSQNDPQGLTCRYTPTQMIQVVDKNSYASLKANWSGSTLFAKTGYIQVQQDKG